MSTITTLPGAPFLHQENGQLFLEGVRLADLAAQYGTPLFAYSKASILAALAAYQKAIEVDENDYRAYYLAAMVMRDGKDYPGAENMLRKAAQLNPDDVNIRRQLGAIVALNLVQTCQEANSCQ